MEIQTNHGATHYFEYPNLAPGWYLGPKEASNISKDNKSTDDTSKSEIAKVALNFVFNGGSALLNILTFSNSNLFHYDAFQEKLETASDVFTRAACGVQGAVLSIDAWRKKNIVSLVSNALDIPIICFSSNENIWFNRGASQGGSQSEAIVSSFEVDGKKYSADFGEEGWAKGLTTTMSVFGKIAKDLITNPSSFFKMSHSLFVASVGQISGTVMGLSGSKLIGPIIRDVFGTMVDYALMKAKKWSLFFFAGFTWIGAAVVDGLKRFEGISQSIGCLTNLSYASDRGASVLYTLGNLLIKRDPENQDPQKAWDNLSKEELEAELALKSSINAMRYRLSNEHYHPMIEKRLEAFNALSSQLLLSTKSLEPESEEVKKIMSLHRKLFTIQKASKSSFFNTWDRIPSFRTEYDAWSEHFSFDRKTVDEQVTKDEWDALFNRVKEGEIDLRVVIHAAQKEIFNQKHIWDAARSGLIDSQKVENIFREYKKDDTGHFVLPVWDIVQPLQLSSDKSKKIFDAEFKKLFTIEAEVLANLKSSILGNTAGEINIADVFIAHKLGHITSEELLNAAEKKHITLEHFLHACRFGLYEKDTVLDHVSNEVFPLEEARKYRGAFSRKRYNEVIKKLYLPEKIQKIKNKLTGTKNDVTYHEIVEAADANLGGINWDDVIDYIKTDTNLMSAIDEQRKAIPLTNEAYQSAFKAAGQKGDMEWYPDHVIKLLREEGEPTACKLREGLDRAVLVQQPFSVWNKVTAV